MHRPSVVSRRVLLTSACSQSGEGLGSSAEVSAWTLARPAWTAVQDARTKGHSSLTAALANAVLTPALFDIHELADSR